MTLLYADTSAIVRAYFPDEDDHEQLRALILEGDAPVATSEIARDEFASAVTGAARAKRLRRPAVFIDRSTPTPQRMARRAPSIRWNGRPLACARLVVEDRLRTLDAIHLAVALEALPELGGKAVAILTRDCRQASAARRHGLAVS
ncbi:MAG: type II toxin-antitoxin system VapC family toxin [Actinomycetota bacterium]|nr:type II toxin-antitoxin system VapC family toxin [Actinomycetota bacterium]